MEHTRADATMLEIAETSLAASAPTAAGPPARPGRLRFLTSRLVWRVAFAVLLSVVVAQALILMPSVRSYRGQLLDQLDRVAIASVKAALPRHAPDPDRYLALLDALLERQSAIRGGALHDPRGRLLGSFGEPPAGTPAAFAAPEARMRGRGGWHESYWSAAAAELPYDVVLRLDSSWLEAEVRRFVRRLAGLTLVISVITAAVTFLTLSRVVLVPLLQLRDTLHAACHDPARPERYQLAVDRSDELGDVVATFNAMLRRIALNLDALRRHREALRGANEQLEQRVAERTRALSTANRSLEAEIGERRQAEARLEHLATHDPLTGLPNRALFRDRLEQTLAHARRQRQMVAVLCLDLDRFKEVNDSLGHPAGDALLKDVARRLLAAVRESDTVARLGGDEFAIVQVGLAQPSGGHALAARLVAALAEPFRLDGHEIESGVSIGIALAPADGDRPDRLLLHADTALRRAKTDGQGAFRFFEAAMDAELRRRRGLERDLRAALAGDQFELRYQPQVDVQSGAVTGFEALLRWRHPDRGEVSPAEFIEVAEDTGLIAPIGAWVVARACADAAAWPAPLRIAVNLSPAQFRHGAIVDSVKAALRVTGLEPRRLEIEITENVLLRETDDTLATLAELRRIGVGIAMDDFGTGYSSLGYLQRFPFDRIKIDRSFVAGLCTHREGLAIIRAVVSLGRSLGMVTTAEGVESEAQLAHLRAEGCTEAQGYLFGRAVRAEDVPKLLARTAVLA